MRKRKMVVIITSFIVIILGIGSFMLAGGIRKSAMSDEQKHESIQTSSIRNPVSATATTSDKKKKSNKQMEENPTSPSPSITPAPSADRSGLKTVTYTGDPSQQEKGEVTSNEEEYQEKRCMEIMHEHGWYKPEDVSITYGSPPENNQSPGAWIWKEDVKGEYAGKEKPAYIKERNKEIEAELQEAEAKGYHQEAFRLSKEFSELNKPYAKDFFIFQINLHDIPKSWHQYFVDIFKFEANTIE